MTDQSLQPFEMLEGTQHSDELSKETTEDIFPHNQAHNTGSNCEALPFIILIVLAGLAAAVDYVVAVYFFINTATPVLAVRIQSWQQGKAKFARWGIGVFLCVLLAAMKTNTVMPAILQAIYREGDANGGRMLLYASTALWECSNTALVVGGEPLLKKFCIDSYPRAVVAGMTPCQVRFVQERRYRLTFRRATHIPIFLSVGWIIRKALMRNEQIIEVLTSWVVLEAEALAVLMSAFVLVFDLPCLIWQIIIHILYFFSEQPCWSLEVILPYGCIYFSSSSRDFWMKWSRPAGELLRYLFYYPLGGANKAYLSIPLMFFLNANAHYDVSRTLVNDRAEKYWNIVFGTLGLNATIEVLANQIIHQHYESPPLWYKLIRGIAAHISLRFALFMLMHHCLKMNVTSFL